MTVSLAQQSTALSSHINSPYNEQDPVITPDGKQLYFTRANHPQNMGGVEDKGDIWVADRLADGTWGAPRNLGRPLNDKFVNSVLGFSQSGDLIFLRNFYINDHNKHIKQGISVARKTNTGWTYPENMEIRYFKNKGENQSISITAGQVMLLSIDSYGSYGAEDIYVSFVEKDGRWTGPKNLGNTINTPFEELSPFLASDMQTLFFCSNGRGGEGSRDIYMSKRLDESWQKWSEPKNLGKDINTEGADMYFILDPDGETAYFSTTQNSNGYGDLRSIPFSLEEDGSEAPPIMAFAAEEVTGQEDKGGLSFSNYQATIIDAVSGKELEGHVEFILKSESNTIDPEFYEEKLTFSKGKLSARLLQGQQYQMDVIVPGYLVEERLVTFTNDISEEIRLEPLALGSTFNLESVLFEVGTANLLENSFPELDKVARMMRENPSLKIELGGHTDNRGNSRLNYLLSLDRVRTVKRYLVDKGIADVRIMEKAYGGSKPIADNTQEETRRLNRRVEFTIVSQ